MRWRSTLGERRHMIGRTYHVVTLLRERGIRIDGIGEQGHWPLDGPALKDIEAAIADLAKTGRQISFTELDVDPLPRPEELIGADVSKPVELTPELDPYADGLPKACSSA
jgi:endo-1,4-beta-xylanase